MVQERRKWSEAQKLQIIGEAIAVFNRWRKFYNERRRHGSLGQTTPRQVWEAYQKTTFASSGEADVGSAGEQPTRNTLASGEEKREEPAPARSSPPNSSLFPSLQKPKNSLTVLNNLSSF